mmetsp:Transcript_25083/g.56930  ORF Transcript_25083/g.56930 Transcript_25083/m.56930 type:complete len:308 (-) Transcript_25083:118-1041(-)
MLPMHAMIDSRISATMHTTTLQSSCACLRTDRATASNAWKNAMAAEPKQTDPKEVVNATRVLFDTGDASSLQKYHLPKTPHAATWQEPATTAAPQNAMKQLTKRITSPATGTDSWKLLMRWACSRYTAARPHAQITHQMLMRRHPRKASPIIEACFSMTSVTVLMMSTVKGIRCRQQSRAQNRPHRPTAIIARPIRRARSGSPQAASRTHPTTIVSVGPKSNAVYMNASVQDFATCSRATAVMAETTVDARSGFMYFELPSNLSTALGSRASMSRKPPVSRKRKAHAQSWHFRGTSSSQTSLQRSRI